MAASLQTLTAEFLSLVASKRARNSGFRVAISLERGL